MRAERWAWIVAAIVGCKEQRVTRPQSSSTIEAPAVLAVPDSASFAPATDPCEAWSETWEPSMSRPADADARAAAPIWCALVVDEGNRRDPIEHHFCAMEQRECPCAEAAARRAMGTLSGYGAAIAAVGGPRDRQLRPRLSPCQPVATVWCVGRESELDCRIDRGACIALRRRNAADPSVGPSGACAERLVR